MRTVMRFLFGGWGRRAAWLALVVFVVLQIAAPALFAIPRLALFDLYQREAPRLQHDGSVVIVAIDEASLKAVGQWPWPRQLMAQLVSKILAARPAALGLDMFMSEPDRSSPEEWLTAAGEMPKALGEALRQLPSHDAVFASALRAGPVMLGIGGADEGVSDTGPLAPFRLFDPLGAPTAPAALPKFKAALRSLAAIDTAARGHGMLSVVPDEDGIFRRLPLVSTVSGRLAPSMVLELLRLAAGTPSISLYVDDAAARGVEVGPLAIPTQDDGSVWIHFSRSDSRRFVSAADVLAGRIDANRFDQKIVLVGVTGLGLTDLRQTPLGFMPGTEINAQLLENILDGRLVTRPAWTRWAEPALTLFFAVLLIVTLRLVRLRWQLVLALTPIAILAATGFGFWHSLQLVDVATPALGQLLVCVSFLAGNFAETDKQRRQLKRELEARKLAEAKAAGEMEAGRRIQMGMLPGAASVAGDRRFDLGALMVPARQIGGDLYDFFKIDDRRLFFAVGDVSGKGVPAALFMALGKSLCKSYALRGTSDVAEVINLANVEISRDNPEMLFITMFAGILDLDTGEVQFCNAGHDTPYLLHKGAPPEAVLSQGGPPLCVMEDFAYVTETLRLMPGDLLCVMTDGVSEAMDPSGALLGAERTQQILAAMPTDVSANAIVDQLYKAVGRFVAGAEASDDLTVLAIRWNGPSAP
ncbi:MAG: CHASE2 domain-containing protein [Alphaproteobacteria bacterium]|nr:CHASE2 domain-containing protein [Alphaproteobacteria bacterium]